MYATPSPEASVGLGASFRPQNNERLSCGSHTKWNINTGCWELIILSTRVTQRCRCDAADYWHVHFQRNTRIRSCSSCLIIRYGPMPRRPGTPDHRLGICLCSTCLRMGFYAALGRVSTLPCCLPNGWVGEGVRFASLSRPMAGVSVFNPAHAHAHQFCPIVTPIQAAENTSKAASYYYNGRMSVQCCLDLARHWGVRSG